MLNILPKHLLHTISTPLSGILRNVIAVDDIINVP